MPIQLPIIENSLDEDTSDGLLYQTHIISHTQNTYLNTKHIFLTNHMKYHHLFKFSPNSFRVLEKLHVSDKHPEKRHLSKYQPKNNFEFEKTTCFYETPGKSPFVQNSAQKKF